MFISLEKGHRGRIVGILNIFFSILELFSLRLVFFNAFYDKKPILGIYANNADPGSEVMKLFSC